MAVSDVCFFPNDAGCGETECDCEPSGIWSCGLSSTCDDAPGGDE
jgi:hypothetical protein